MTFEDNYYDNYDMIESNRKLLENVGGIAKITPVSQEQRKDLNEIISEYSDLDSFEILSDKGVDIILRYKRDDPRINVSGVIGSSKSAYTNGDYRKCIKKGLVALRTAMFPKSDLYEVMGLSYYQMNMTDRAYDYLRVACHLENVKDYNKLSVKDMVERVEEKMKFSSKENKNNYNIFNNEREIHIDGLNVPNFDKIIEYVREKKIDLETAGRELGLSNEQVDFIKLIYARELYKQGDIEKGNYYLNSVEKTSGKTSDVTRLLLEARTNKLFFQYRDNNKPKKLALIKTGIRRK